MSSAVSAVVDAFKDQGDNGMSWSVTHTIIRS
jgi:hypothetical protein